MVHIRHWLAAVPMLLLAFTAAAQSGSGSDVRAQQDSDAAAVDALFAEPTESEQPTTPDAIGTIAVAQLTEPPPLPETQEADTEQPARLEEIVVTATKREKSEREIPASVSAMSGEKLERLGVQSVEEITRLVPGVNITQPVDNAARITIRGIAAQPSTNMTTGMLFGDVSFTDTYLPTVTLDPNPFDLRTVEVLKGPQGTLFGAGALNGAIRYVPEPPAFGVFETKYFAQYTSVEEGDADLTYGAAVNLPFGGEDEFALRLVGVDRQAPGWVDNTQVGEDDANWIDQQSFRGILGWRPGSAWDISLTYAMQDTRTIETPISDNLDGRLEASNKPRLSPSESSYDFGALRVGYDFSSVQVIAETAYIRKQAESFQDGTSRLPMVPGVPTQGRTDESHSDTWSQELRLVSNDSGDGRWQWVTGVAAWQQDLDYKLQTPITPPVLAVIPGLADLLAAFPTLNTLFADDGSPSLANVYTDVSVKEIAWFGDVTRRLWDDWELSVGGRLYRTTSGGVAKQSGLALFAVNLTPEYVIDDEIEEQGFNPKASLLWHASDNVLAYLGAGRGFRVGGIQPGFTPPTSTMRAPDTFKSDTLWNYELGVRTQWFDNRLRFDLTGFHADWKDPQTFQLDQSGLGAYLDNVGGVESDGIEMALQALLPIPGMTLTTAAAYVDTVTTEPFVATGGAMVEPGTRWAFAPEWQTATSLVQLLPMGNWLFNVGVTHTYISKAPVSLTPDAQDPPGPGHAQYFEVFGFQQWDLQLGVRNPAVAWMPEVSLIANNLTDERGITHYWASGIVDTQDVTYIRPRALTLRISGRF